MLTRGAVRTVGVCTRYCTRYTSTATDEPEFDDFEEYPSGNIVFRRQNLSIFHSLFRVPTAFFLMNLMKAYTVLSALQYIMSPILPQISTRDQRK